LGDAVARRLFTPAEANSALVEVRPVAERLVATRARMRELLPAQTTHVTAIAGNGDGRAAQGLHATRSELERLAEDVAACVRELDELGAVVKDLDTGLLDFPALRGGREVELCWRLGEERVEHWHDLEAGFAGRKRIDWGE
jgi:hypothetical protein